MTAKVNDYTVEQLTDYFYYLDCLRESGATNMWGAGSFLEEEYGMNGSQSKVVLLAWMRSFDKDASCETRARKVLS